jgi:hypothetical protein
MIRKLKNADFRKGIYKPTIEEAIEIGGIEPLHSGGFALTKRTACFNL